MNRDGVHCDVGFEINIPAMAAIYSVGSDIDFVPEHQA